MQLGSTFGLEISKDICPTCSQPIKGSLLSNDSIGKTMGIEDNIISLKNDIQLVEISLAQINKEIQERITSLDKVMEKINSKNEYITKLEVDLYSNRNSLSEAKIYKKIKLEKELKDCNIFEDILVTFNEELNELIKRRENVLSRESKLPKDYFSDLDRKKLKNLKDEYIKNLQKFGYNKLDNLREIGISDDKYLPTLKDMDMKFEVSASEWIRGIWSYTCALLTTSLQLNGNHLNLVVFDEPGQHQMKEEDMTSFIERLKILSKESQIIVATSFNEEEIRNISKRLNIKLFEIPEGSNSITLEN